MVLKNLQWKHLLVYSLIAFALLLILLLLPSQYSLVLFPVLSILSVGLGLWIKVHKRSSLSLQNIHEAARHKPFVAPIEQKNLSSPEVSATQKNIPQLPIVPESTLRPVAQIKFLTLEIHIGVQELVDPKSQTIAKAWINMRKTISRALPLTPFVIGVLIFGLFMRSFVQEILIYTQGHFTYNLDDAYIHMAIAKNFALHGVWGSTPYGFSSTSSSPLWTLILSGIYRVVGPLEAAPFVLNMICVVLLFALICYSLQRRGVAPLYVTFLLPGIMLLTPFFATVLTGMEHALHMLCITLFLHLALDLFSQSRVSSSQVLAAGVAAALMMGARYESIFLLLLTCGLLLLRGRFVSAIVVGSVGIMPVFVYGLISISHGWHFFPNSLILKTEPYVFDSLNSITVIVRNGIQRLMEKPELLLLFVIILVALLVRQNIRRVFWNDRASIGLLLVAFSIWLHRTFVAGYSPYNRYDAYLFVIGFYVLGLALRDLSPRTFFQIRTERIPTYAALALLVVSFSFVGYIADTERDSWQIGGGSRNIYAQQYQMARFVQQFYDDSSVALNDIGAVSFLSNAHIADLVGLASDEPAIAKLDGNYSQEFIGSFTRAENVDLAIVYDSWFTDKIPPEWVTVGTWEVVNSGILGSGLVTFYAAHPEDAPTLAANMREFASSLPPDATSRIIFGEPAAQ